MLFIKVLKVNNFSQSIFGLLSSPACLRLVSAPFPKSLLRFSQCYEEETSLIRGRGSRRGTQRINAIEFYFLVVLCAIIMTQRILEDGNLTRPYISSYGFILNSAHPGAIAMAQRNAEETQSYTKG